MLGRAIMSGEHLYILLGWFIVSLFFVATSNPRHELVKMSLVATYSFALMLMPSLFDEGISDRSISEGFVFACTFNIFMSSTKCIGIIRIWSFRSDVVLIFALFVAANAIELFWE